MIPSTSGPAQTSEYSLWLMPSGQVGEALAGIITELGREFLAPVFPPHVTLLGGLKGAIPELTIRARLVAEQLGPYDLALGRLDYLDEYYRCLFVRILETEPVLRANDIARRVFGRLGGPAYMPHLSLLYGDFTPDAKESIIKRIGTSLDYRFLATELYLYSTSGETSTWRNCGKFELARTGDTSN